MQTKGFAMLVAIIIITAGLFAGCINSNEEEDDERQEHAT